MARKLLGSLALSLLLTAGCGDNPTGAVNETDRDVGFAVQRSDGTVQTVAAEDVGILHATAPSPAAKGADGYMRGHWETAHASYTSGVNRMDDRVVGAFSAVWLPDETRYQALATCHFADGEGGVIVGGTLVSPTEYYNALFVTVLDESITILSYGQFFAGQPTESSCQGLLAAVRDLPSVYQEITSGRVMAE